LALFLVVPAFLLLMVGNLRRAGTEKNLARERAVTIAKLAAANESYYVRQSRQQLATLAQLPLTLMPDRALTEKALRTLRRLSQDFDDFGLVETNGIVFCHTLGSNVTRTVHPRLVSEVLRKRDFAAAVFFREVGSNQPILQFGYPVTGTNGELARVMYASLKTPLLSEALKDILLPDNSAASVFDVEGNLLARRPDPEKWVGKQYLTDALFRKAVEGKEGIFETEGVDGVKRLYAVTRVNDHNTPVLYVTVGLPRSDAFGAAHREFVRDSLVLVAVVAVLLAAAWWYSHAVFVRPAAAIVQAADRLSEGDLKARTGLTRQKTELHRIAERFDQMAASLERRQSELEKANAEIKSHAAELEKRVEERTSELQALNSELEAFSYSVSHDLRAPLRHMDGFAQMLLKNPIAEQDVKVKRHLTVITTAAMQMGMLIDDLLAFSRTGRQALRVGDVNFDEMVREMAEQETAREAGRAIEWKIESLPTVRGDASLLRQVWLNLLSNAIKYSRGKNPAVIEISSRHEGAERIFSVRDNGAGFDMAYSDKLFGVFQRLHQQSEFEGTGIGLANVRRIVTRHGGRTWAESKLGEGATFYFSLPH
jgi:signal transduction histidine kinase